jgi:subtilase family serine protease
MSVLLRRGHATAPGDRRHGRILRARHDRARRRCASDLQFGAVGASRGVPDIAMSGAWNGAVNVYQSFTGNKPGWYQVCGTSEATPLFAGVVSLADQVAGHPLGLINPRLYQLLAQHAPGLVDVTAGKNTVAFTQGGSRHTVTGFTVGPGYDLASGTGTVNAPQFVYELAGK